MKNFLVKISVFLLLVSYSQKLHALTVSGFEPAYAGVTLKFKTLTDPVSKNEKPVFQLVIDDKGNFSTQMSLDKMVFCFCDFGIYRGNLILVPGENISLKLPPRKEKSFEESKNPYFEPVGVWLMVNESSSKDLTNLISRFDDRFYDLNDQYFNQLFYRNQKNYLDTIRRKLDNEFSANFNPVFISHRDVRLKTLEADMARSGREKLIGSLKLSEANEWNMPAFADLFNSLFVNTLSNESKTIAGTRIKQWIRDRNMAELKKWAVTFTSATPPLADLILLKMLHDAYYSGDFSKPAILAMLRSDGFMQNPESRIILITREVISKLTWLEKGSPAPEICLNDLSGVLWCTTSNLKSYLYILFADLDIPICREQIKYLKTIQEKTENNLQFVLVVPESGRTNIRKFIEENGIPGKVLTGPATSSFAATYKVRSYPTAFLLDKNHRIVLAPAKTPLDGFEFQFSSFR